MTVSHAYSADDIAAILGRPAPTTEQREIIEAPLENMLVVAGAGSGKTETMASRVVWLIANGHALATDVLGLTFTRKAAGELSHRISSRLQDLADAGIRPDPDGPLDVHGDDQSALTVSTYHAFAGRIVEEHGLRLGIEPDTRLLTEAAAWQLAHDVVTSYDGPMDAIGSAESTVTTAVVALAGEMAEHLCDLGRLDEYYHDLAAHLDSLPAGATRARSAPARVRELRSLISARRQLLPVVAAYARAKRDHDAMDFADQVALAARLAADFPDVARDVRERHRVVLLDEFQDTSEAQMSLLRSLFAMPHPGARPAVPVMAVGDPHQSIYGWRGASATTLSRFPTLFAQAQGPAPVRHLSVSWRNDEAVLEVADALAAPLTQESTIPSRRLGARPGAAVGRVEAARWESSQVEAAQVAARIAGEWYDEQGRVRGISAAVLCRRRAQFAPMVEALQAQRLPVEVVGLGGLLSMPDVADVVALLSVVADPGRGDRLMRLLTGPAYRIGAADLDGLAAWSRQLRRREHDASGTSRVQAGPDPAGIVEALAALPPSDWTGPEGERIGLTARTRLRELAGVVSRLRALSGAGVADLVVEAERALGVDVELLSRPEVPPEGARVYLDAFAETAASFQQTVDRATLGGFLAWLDVAAVRERGLEAPAAEVSDTAVQVLTIHAAKGLEWDVVAIPGLVEGAFPSSSATVSTYRDERWVVSPIRDKGWCVGLERLPYDLRGDRRGLPVLSWQTAVDLAGLDAALARFADDGGRRVVAEERRLAYVAVTRARHLALVSAPVWSEATTPRVTSRFLAEIVDDPALAESVAVTQWTSMPSPGPDGRAVHPGTGAVSGMSWPADPMASRRSLVRPAAELVRDEWARLPQDPRMRSAEIEQEIRRGAAAGSDVDLQIVALVEEVRLRRDRDRRVIVDLPAHLSASSLIGLYDDEKRFAERLRRPMPAAPATRARAGTAFHAWVEEHYQRATIWDVDDLPGGADSEELVDLSAAKARFLASEWAHLVPLEIELAVETFIGGLAVRGRIDAVFEDHRRQGGRDAGQVTPVVVVDWKTGRPPTGRAARVAAVQLGVYRLAYARLREIPVTAVRGAFYYVATGETVFPELPDEAELVKAVEGVGMAGPS
ncbi:ATP-dependent DNA helicase Rep [Austwickia sp. TVS 96-490-7B]|uniref:ATP-dependent DNA helicase n=1 Tax=Austwickia sp. TVS 96-490-7B TaxID=2830843 RepID=UPI001C55FC9C|nr:ATP-dependent DNA helicase [Austwickia sp. TVS 96-490-7B]MBW3086622.1 ATP-dependent DNA helicase Rep [Austwickia sp. TVS 96-490-7B]